MSEESTDPGVTKAEMLEARTRLKKAREAAGKQPEDLAEFVGNSDSNYYDLENCDGELYMCISLAELSALSAALGIKVRDLFDDGKRADLAISPDQLIGMAKQHLSQTASVSLNLKIGLVLRLGPAWQTLPRSWIGTWTFSVGFAVN
jgi:DNA-binding XRE family transcriptional regulator